MASCSLFKFIRLYDAINVPFLMIFCILFAEFFLKPYDFNISFVFNKL